MGNSPNQTPSDFNENDGVSPKCSIFCSTFLSRKVVFQNFPIKTPKKHISNPILEGTKKLEEGIPHKLSHTGAGIRLA